ncbi:MAG TPA: polynucleotide adenylyltransferase, partial [Spirochaetia bacterium]|nr:polynucleotide adenylyltransferase [Spirochaetia bacterium]
MSIFRPGAMLPPRELRDFAKVFQQAGFQCYLVGGALRNIAMRRPHTDWDIATDATPEQVGSIFQRVIPTGARHGTVTVHFRKLQIEVTTFRIESDYSDSRHPDSVTFTRDIHEDLKRRDFTMNAMALNLHDGAFVDPHNGLMDIKGSIIRAIGVPDERFSEDGLRILRAVRFAAQLDFAVDDDTRRAMTGSLARLSSVSPERIRDELSKTLQSPHPSIGLNLAQETGVLKSILPELDACVGVEQATAPRALIFAFSGPTRADSAPSFDVFKHSILACDGAPADVLELRMAALLHDIGKAPTF